MASPRITISLTETRAPLEVTRVLLLAPPNAPPITTTWRYQGSVLPPPLDDRLDMALVAAIFRCLRLGGPVHVEGTVSRTLLRHIELFTEAWTAWRPGVYRPITITAAREIDDCEPDTKPYVLAYSGGLDSNATLLRHVRGQAGRNTREILTACLVHGFDIPLSDAPQFALADHAAAETLAYLGVRHTRVGTDWRATLCSDWEMEFFAGLAATLYAFAGDAGGALIANDMNWYMLPRGLPWSSNHATNPLLQSGRFRILTDGAGMKRVEVARMLAAEPFVLARLRVCYVEPKGRLNCGLCSKCVRRQVQFLAAGIDPGPAFPVRPGFLQMVTSLLPRAAMQFTFSQETIRAAQRHGADRGSWFRAIRLALALGRVRWALRAVKRAALGQRS